MSPDAQTRSPGRACSAGAHIPRNHHRLPSRRPGEDLPRRKQNIMNPESAQAAYLTAITTALSPTRLRHAFRASRDESETVVLARYFRNLALCESLYPVLHVLEITLRNRVDEVMGSAFPATPPRRRALHAGELPSTGSWLDADPGVLAPGDREEIGRTKARAFVQERKAPSSDQVVEGLSLGFWTGLFTRVYEISPRSSYNPADGKPTAFWPRHLKAVFPHLPRRLRTRQHVYSVLSELTRLRNLVFHHRPVWHLKLNPLHTSATGAIGWISPEVQRTLLHLDRFPAVYNRDADDFVRLVGRIAAHEPPNSG